MITVTGGAAAAIRRMTNTRVYPGAGLRIAAHGRPGRFAFALVSQPSAGDVAVGVPGTQLYLDREATAALGDAVLDADATAERVWQLSLRTD
ncbi:hypothetical protein AB0M43_35955 [Longispora sp. NPDC051575]|uniref:hypothetical protein n=1 Tax=Longispora sp. NPDC051575 TaxID=3154943 RepID=UPI00341FD251